MSAGGKPWPWLRYWPLAPVLAAGMLLRFAALGRSALLQDEAYYWLWSRWLAPSYYDHPAGVALLIRLSTLVGGQTEVGIRWLNATLGLVVLVACYGLTLRLGSRAAAVVAAAWVASAPPYLLTSRFVYTDALQLALMLAALLPVVALLVQPECELTWARALTSGALWGLALLSKYSAYLAAALALGALLASRPDLARRPRFWVGIGVAALGLAPTLAWNATHDWASFRWQVSHFGVGALVRSTFGARMRNLLDYVGAPLLLFASLGVLNMRGHARRMLWLVGVGTSLPVALSPANSPRNLSSGIALLVILAADAVERWTRDGRVRRPWALGGTVSLLLLNGLLGLGSVAESMQPTWLPHNRASTLLRQDAAGWRGVERLGLDPATTVFTVDYSIAGQLAYYLGRPVHTAWGQFRLWGEPSLESVQVVALPFADGERLQDRLHQGFGEVVGPEERTLGAGPDVKVLRIWRARGPRAPAAQIVADLDLAGLLPPP